MTNQTFRINISEAANTELQSLKAKKINKQAKQFVCVAIIVEFCFKLTIAGFLFIYLGCLMKIIHF